MGLRRARAAAVAAALTLWTAGACERCGDDQRPPRPAALAAQLARFEPWPACDAAPERVAHFRLLLGGRPAGSSRLSRRRCRTPAGLRWLVRRSEQLALQRQGRRVELHQEQLALIDGRGRLLRLRRRSGQPGETERLLHAGRVGDEMLTLRGSELRRMPFDPDALALALYPRFLWPEQPPEPATVHRFRAYSPHSAGYVQQRVEVLAGGAAGSVRLARRAADQPGARTVSRYGPGWRLERRRSSMGALHLEAVRRAAAPEPALPRTAPDISGLMRVRTVGRIADPARLHRARYRIEGLAVVEAALDRSACWTDRWTGPGQRPLDRADGGVADGVRIAVRRLAAPPPVAFPPPAADHERWLAPTDLVQRDHPRIRALARRLTAGAGTAWQAALALRRWVAAAIDSQMGLSFASALEVLRAGSGDCSEKAVLLVALARAAGIPARAVTGLVYHRGAFRLHMWAEVRVGRWQPLDAALGPERVSAARIRFAVDPLALGPEGARTTATMAALLTGGLRVIVEQTGYAAAARGAQR
jgi:hypothetical protein